VTSDEKELRWLLHKTKSLSPIAFITPFQFRSISTKLDTLHVVANCWWMGLLDESLLGANPIMGEILEPISGCHNFSDLYLTICDQVVLIGERYPIFWEIDSNEPSLFVSMESVNTSMTSGAVGQIPNFASNAVMEP
jgi:hypothetical protein